MPRPTRTAQAAAATKVSSRRFGTFDGGAAIIVDRRGACASSSASLVICLLVCRRSQAIRRNQRQQGAPIRGNQRESNAIRGWAAGRPPIRGYQRQSEGHTDRQGRHARRTKTA
eukprot:2836187-Prymnesium_polylepis.1